MTILSKFYVFLKIFQALLLRQKR